MIIFLVVEIVDAWIGEISAVHCFETLLHFASVELIITQVLFLLQIRCV